MIPYLNQKIWYAFQGLPVERVDQTDYLPWSKCLVLTNNLMHILQLNHITDAFKQFFDQSFSQESKGVTFEEYTGFLDKYLNDRSPSIETTGENDRNSNPIIQELETPPEQEKRLRGNTMESLPTTDIKATGFNLANKFECDTSSLLKTFDDYCWTLYRTKNLPQLSIQSSLYMGFFNLWRVFIMYSMKRDQTDEITIPVKMDVVEAQYWCGRIKELLRSRRQFDDVEITEEVTGIDYKEFYVMVQNILKCSGLGDSICESVLQELADEALDGVVMKGPIKVDHSIRYCVLKSFTFVVYGSKIGATNLRSCYTLNPDTKILAGTNRIQIKIPGVTFVSTVNLEIADVHTLNKWHAGFTDAIELSKTNNHNPALTEAKRREDMRKSKRSTIRAKRLDMEIQLEIERKKRSKVLEDMELQLRLAGQKFDSFRQQMENEITAKEIIIKENENMHQETEAHILEVIKEQQTEYKIQLEKLQEIEKEKERLNVKLLATMEEKSYEELKRNQMEEKHLEAQKMLHEAEYKINSLERLGEQLEKALEDERMAKEEEEAVRNATISLLEEEYRSKENLEALLRQQNDMIDQEIQKRNAFALELENERNRIKSIAEEKEKLAKQLEETHLKMQSSESRVRKLDTKVTQIADNVFGKADSRVPVSHRGQGFIAEMIVQSKLKKAAIESSKENK